MMLLLATKTFWTGAATLLAAAGGYFTGELALAEALQMASTALIGVFLRHGMLKGDR